MDDLDRMFRRLVQNIRMSYPDLLSRPFEVSQLYQNLLPYRHNRRELEIETNQDYEIALMRLLSGERGYLVVEDSLQEAMRNELQSGNPDTAAFRIYSSSHVSIAPEAVRHLESATGATTPSRPSVATAAPAPQSAPQPPKAPAPPPVAPPPPAPTVPRPSAPPTMNPRPGSAGTPSAPASAHTPPAPPRPSMGGTSGSNLASTQPFGRPSAHNPIAPPRGSTPSMPQPATSSTPRTSAAGTCRYCSGALPAGRSITFCPHCGQNLTIQHCPACSTELEIGWKFCTTCGRSIGVTV
jgi:hypothetical protein